MRYQNWDVLVFPDECNIPLQEFKTTCQVIQDPEAPNNLPTVTSFIPGLEAGAAFRVSIHSWQNPQMSRTIQSLCKPTSVLIFEARLLIDGQIAGTKLFGQNEPWPSIIAFGIDLNKDGEFDKLEFPKFHRELLSQSYWNAGDDLGRIKLVIAEGFSRENVAYPFDRIRNIVSFSFQHAPLNLLESSQIAWPNAGMWRQASLLTSYLVQQQQQLVDFETHSHSPRYASTSRQFTYDPFTEPISYASLKGWCQVSSNTSMPDYASDAVEATTKTIPESDPTATIPLQAPHLYVKKDNPAHLQHESNSTGNEVTIRKVTPFGACSGNKRPRNLSGATNVTDEEDEPRSSPSLRKSWHRIQGV